MEDRYSAVVDDHGDSTQVCSCYVNSDFVFRLYSEENRGKEFFFFFWGIFLM